MNDQLIARYILALCNALAKHPTEALMDHIEQLLQRWGNACEPWNVAMAESAAAPSGVSPQE